MRWLIREPSFLAIVFSICMTGFTFGYRWTVVGRIFESVHLWWPNYAKDLSKLGLIFGLFAFASFVWFLIVVFQRKKQEGSGIEKLATKSDIEKLATDFDSLVRELRADKHGPHGEDDN